MSSSSTFALGSPILLTAPSLPRTENACKTRPSRRCVSVDQHEARRDRLAVLRHASRRKHCSSPYCCFWVSDSPARTCWSLLDRPSAALSHSDAISHPRRSRRMPKQLPKLSLPKPVRLATPPPSSEEGDELLPPFCFLRPSSPTLFSAARRLPRTPVSSSTRMPQFSPGSPVELPLFPFRQPTSTSTPPVTPKSSPPPLPF
ncbi:hypothetical protein AURDEDRAFT_110866 [Auricularia subglabra TFB-10046 SS5]|nr:hypothetical protein AURDEDRAFT_110866 [Auricularia subglabra TFB-10046 SS5]